MKSCSDCGKDFDSSDHKHIIEDTVLCGDCYEDYKEFVEDSKISQENDTNNSDHDSEVFTRIAELEKKKKELEEGAISEKGSFEKITPTHKSPSLAILLAILIMGAGHLYIGKFGRGAGLFFTAFFFSFLAVFNPFWWIFIVGLYIFAIYDINSSFNGTDNQEKSKNVVGGIVLKIIAILFIIFFAIGALAFFGVLSPDEYLPPEDIKYSLNQEIPVDYLSYKIITAESFTKMGTSVFEKETAGKFIKVYLSITNKAKETKDIFSPRFKIEDSQGRRFDKLSDDMLYISDYIGFGEQLQPGLTVSGAVVFELPNDAEGLNLVIVGDWLSETEAIVNLGNIRSIGQDKTLKEQQDAMLEDLFDY